MFTIPEFPPELAGSINYQDYILFFFVLKLLAEGYSSVRSGGGLKRILSSFWFGEQAPKVVLDDYKKELSNPPFPPK